MLEIEVSRINLSDKTTKKRTDYIAEETPLHIFINKHHYGTILCSPYQLKEMAVGHLLSEGLLKTTDELCELLLKKDGKCLVKVNPDVDVETRISKSQRISRLIVSACGAPDYRPFLEIIGNLPKSEMKLTVKPDVISRSIIRLNTIAKRFRQTGGVHVAALYSTTGKIISMAEDVGRHNAVDKVIGSAIIKNADIENLFLALSGRLTGDIVLKAARMKISVIASLAAAISSGLEAAQTAKITLIGFVRGKRMNVYTYPERIVFSSHKN